MGSVRSVVILESFTITTSKMKYPWKANIVMCALKLQRQHRSQIVWASITLLSLPLIKLRLHKYYAQKIEGEWEPGTELHPPVGLSPLNSCSTIAGKAMDGCSSVPGPSPTNLHPQYSRGRGWKQSQADAVEMINCWRGILQSFRLLRRSQMLTRKRSV